MSDDDNKNEKTGSKVDELFKAAQDDGAISPASMRVLALIDPGAQIQSALGVCVDDVPASEVVLVTMMPDDSGSIRFSGSTQAVRDGHNLVLEALAKAQQQASVLVHTRYLNGAILYPYCGLEHAVKMDSRNYDPCQGTPLYDQTVVLLATVLAKAQEFAAAGVPVRTVTLLITDGADEHSNRARAADVRRLVDDLQGGAHVVAAMGIDNGSTDFRTVFRDMGIDDRWILTPGNSAQEIRKAFQVFSQSAIRVSQAAATFSKTALGGFTN